LHEQFRKIVYKGAGERILENSKGHGACDRLRRRFSRIAEDSFFCYR
jgi:hypothetical protein